MKLARCDECDHERRLDHWHAAPDGWLVVEQASEIAGHHSWYFCSRSCIATFFLMGEIKGVGDAISQM